MKHNYQTPAMRVIELKYRSQLLQISGQKRVQSLGGNVFGEGDIESDENYNGEIR